MRMLLIVCMVRNGKKLIKIKKMEMIKTGMVIWQKMCEYSVYIT